MKMTYFWTLDDMLADNNNSPFNNNCSDKEVPKVNDFHGHFEL